MKLQLRDKLLLGFIAVAIVGASIGIFGVINLKQLDDKDTYLYEKNTKPLGDMVVFSDCFLNQRVLVYNLFFAKNKEELDHLMTGIDELTKGTVNAEKDFKSTIVTQEQEDRFNKYLKVREEYLTVVNKVYNLLVDNKKDLALEIMNKEAVTAANIFENVLNDGKKELIDGSKETSDSNTKTANFTITAMIAITIVGLIVSIILAIWIGVYMISKPLLKISGVLNTSASQMAAGSAQLSSAAQEISNGASEQASSIEETTSSMEELASMVKQNVSNARESSIIAEKTQNYSADGSLQMEKMLEAMNEINKSAEEIANITEIIDDIAFQTNMLALNASVEAARAGEVGMGFAVVADEVKSLANRSGESAKETSKVVRESIKRIESGLAIANKLSEIFKEIVSNTSKVTTMAREVETASKQQDQGISEVNKALVQFDAVIQTNAASAEETASSAEELMSQVDSLNGVVNSLVVLVKGGLGQNAGRQEVIRPEQTHFNNGVHTQEHKTASTSHQLAASVNGNGISNETRNRPKISFESDEEFTKPDNNEA
jgi:methyl-accepting chemotaxis protein